MLAFIHIHKTGGTTLQWILRSSLGSRYCELEPRAIAAPYTRAPFMAPASVSDLEYATRLYQDLAGIGGHHVQPHMGLHKQHPSIRYFAFMRDPLKMRASLYQHGVEALGPDNCQLEDWLQETQSQNRQTQMIAGVPDVDRAIQIIQENSIFVGLTERFDESLLLLKRLVAGELDIAYRRMNVAAGTTIARELLASSGTRALLAENNEVDQQLYDFVKNELYPSYQRAYGDGLAEDVEGFRLSLSDLKQSRTTLSQMRQPRLRKLLLFFDSVPYNQRNVARAFFKKHFLYRPYVRLHRKGITH